MKERKLGRPRTFDADTALEKAMKVFWEKGYEGSSLPELTEAMGMNRPSMYAVFGNKENLFKLALERYGASHDPLFEAALQQPTAREVVEHFLRGNADAQTEEENPHGCLVINGALACSDDALPIRNTLIERRAAAEDRLKQRFIRASQEGDLPPNFCAGQMARYVMTVSNGMAVQSAAGATREHLQQVVDQVLYGWPKK
ncbi:TetR/AcrR family transcriptional regulator [Duganella sp. sic0402]|uniref:TetR/AcrR family transcriptional regulator n=1 Tax=Duganella sp. sic0402 TaxID=2854786 RepID=UPI001C44CFE2|nr:TetR/AcrR family transcriptional regulator [Duganella sp. sic0402]MBV7535413.1 TetR/AcrR family transcriptional regulator [Duganella sp. sic0402]